MGIERRWNRNEVSRESPDKAVNRRPTSLKKFRADYYYYYYYYYFWPQYSIPREWKKILLLSSIETADHERDRHRSQRRVGRAWRCVVAFPWWRTEPQRARTPDIASDVIQTRAVELYTQRHAASVHVTTYVTIRDYTRRKAAFTADELNRTEVLHTCIAIEVFTVSLKLRPYGAMLIIIFYTRGSIDPRG